MNEHTGRDKETGLDCYDPERRLFPKIANKVRTGQALSKGDVLLILRWKLGRLKDSNSQTITDTNIRRMNDAVRDARQNERKVAALAELQEVPGIGLATATVILTVCYPEEFTVIDWRVLSELDLFPSKMTVAQQSAKRERDDYNTDDWTAESYVREYLPKVNECAKLWDCSLREADRALWGLSVHRRIQELIKESQTS